MTLVLFIGGARSGKSALAVELARAAGGPVTFVATAEAGDAEMAERIRRHRGERPAEWTTVEEALDLAGALTGVTGAAIVDCLSFWVANALGRGDADGDVEAAAGRAAACAAARDGLTVAVTNEVGLGVVPAVPLGRRYRDVLGRVNQLWADAADRVALVVAGRALPLERARDLHAWIASPTR